MADLYGFVQQNSPGRAADGTSRGVRVTRDGAVLEVPWIQALCLEGRLFGCGPGATALGVAAGTFGAGAIDTDEFDYLQTIPATVAVIPVYLRVSMVTVGTALESGMHAFWGASGVIGANSVAVTPHNLRPASSNLSACTVAVLGDDGGTTFVPAGLICRDVTTALTGVAGTPQQFIPQWSVAQAGFTPVLEGLASPGRQISIWVDGQAGTGYIHFVYAELPISAVA